MRTFRGLTHDAIDLIRGGKAERWAFVNLIMEQQRFTLDAKGDIVRMDTPEVVQLMMPVDVLEKMSDAFLEAHNKIMAADCAREIDAPRGEGVDDA